VRYKVLSKQGIALARDAIRDRTDVPDLTSYEVIKGSGAMLEESRIKALVASIREKAAQIRTNGKPYEELDRECFELVHSSLPRTEALVIGDMDFWVWLAITHLADVIHFRFPGRKGLVNLNNFGLGSRKECWPYKLWVRGEDSFDDSISDPYVKGRLGSVDLWTSHVHRQNFMSIRAVFSAVFEFQYPPSLGGKPFLFEGQENFSKNGTRGLRSLIKRLSENWATVEYSCLDFEQAKFLVKEHSNGLNRADG